MATSLRWGILSTAKIGRTKVVAGLQAGDRCEVVAMASRVADRARATADALGIPRAHGSYEALLADPEVDAVYIPLPNVLHEPWTIKAAEAGKHVLCEKPLATTAEAAERMIAACERAGVTLMEAYMYRLHPSWEALLEVVRSGEIGRLVTLSSWFSYHNAAPANIRNSRALGGGALNDIGGYCVDLSRMVFGSEPTRVLGSIRRDPAGGTDALTTGILEFPEGIASFTASTRILRDQRVDVYGTEGRVSLDVPFNIPPDAPTFVRVYRGGDAPVATLARTIEIPPADAYAIQASRFAAAVLDGAPLPVPPSNAVANLRVMEALVATDPRELPL